MIKKEVAELKKVILKGIEHYGSAEAMCWELGLAKSTISNILNSTQDFRLSTLKKVAEALGYEYKITLRKK